MIALTSLIALAFCAASIFVKFTLNTVFSLGFSGSAAPAPASPDPPEAATGAAEATGSAISTMLSRDYFHMGVFHRYLSVNGAI